MTRELRLFMPDVDVSFLLHIVYAMFCFNPGEVMARWRDERQRRGVRSTPSSSFTIDATPITSKMRGVSDGVRCVRKSE